MSFRLHATDLVRSHGPAVVFVSVTGSDESNGIGTAFHLGEGWFATARHVIENRRIVRVGRLDVTQRTHRLESGRQATTTTWPEWSSDHVEHILFHPDERADVAVFHAPDFVGPEIQLETRSEALAYNEFLLHEVLVLGYPPIPFSKHPFLVCIRAEVSAVVEDYFSNRRHFILSGLPRGGFSGGVALTLSFPPRTLGVVTKALVTKDQPVELGFAAALSAELVFELLDVRGIRIKTVEMTKAGFILQPPPEAPS